MANQPSGIKEFARKRIVALKRKPQIIALVVLALAYLFASPIWLRKVGFFGALAALLLFLGSNVFAWQQKRGLDHRTGAVVIRSAVNVKSTPSRNGTDLFILHEGTRVTITDSSMKGWKEIRVGDGKQGWLETKEIEVI